MKYIKHYIVPIFLMTIWVSMFEFVRNQLLFVSYWTNHYQSMGLVFPAKSANGMVWGIWAMVFASLVLVIGKKFTYWWTVFISWIAGFVMMWLVIGNLGVLPYKLLIFAIPMSIAEVMGATWIAKKFSKQALTVSK